MKRGNGNLYMLGLMFAVMLFVGGVTLIEPIRESISTTRTDMSCGTGGLDTYTDMACIVIGSMLPVYALAVVGVAIAAFNIRRIFTQGE